MCVCVLWATTSHCRPWAMANVNIRLRKMFRNLYPTRSWRTTMATWPIDHSAPLCNGALFCQKFGKNPHCRSLHEVISSSSAPRRSFKPRSNDERWHLSANCQLSSDNCHIIRWTGRARNDALTFERRRGVLQWKINRMFLPDAPERWEFMSAKTNL